MIETVINEVTEAVATGAVPDLVGTMTAEVYDPSTGVTIVPSTSAGITQPRPGTYRWTFTIPTVGTYMVRWDNQAGGIAEEFLVVRASAVVVPTLPSDVSEFTPSTREVAAFIKNRTVDEFNNFVGDFTNETTVTAEEVAKIVDQAEELVLRRLKLPPAPEAPPLPQETVEAVRNLIALLSASIVELTKFGEQIQTGRSPYPQLRELFDMMLGWLATDILGETPGDAGAGGLSLWDLIQAGSGTAYFNFPENVGQVSWGTKF